MLRRPTTYPPRKSALILLLAMLGVSAQGVTLADDFCSQPVAPYCADKDSDFQSKLEVDRCQEDLSDYEKELSEYEQCVKDQIAALRKELSEAKKKLQEAKDKL